jgi:hypothetical protein
MSWGGELLELGCDIGGCGMVSGLVGLWLWVRDMSSRSERLVWLGGVDTG